MCEISAPTSGKSSSVRKSGFLKSPFPDGHRYNFEWSRKKIKFEYFFTHKGRKSDLKMKFDFGAIKMAGQEGQKPKKCFKKKKSNNILNVLTVLFVSVIILQLPQDSQCQSKNKTHISITLYNQVKSKIWLNEECLKCGRGTFLNLNELCQSLSRINEFT